MTESSGAATRSVGRPRRTGTAGQDPRQEILDAASRLFVERGYAATTMTEVARAVGLGQSSMYYWFRSKEDLLKALASANRESLEVAERLADSEVPAAVHLYAVLHADVRQMCGGTLDFYDLERVARAQPETFAEILDDYGRLRAAIEQIIGAGIASGEFAPMDPRLATVACLAQTEGVQHRFRTPTPDTADRPSALGDPSAAARLAARTAVRALLADPAQLADVERRGLAELVED
ncbi:TetR family transcriptional regulator [Aeromicrobium sp. 636]|uniref:TetR/AcrR family transcriptional regulator n=1 Tax=Aeromicrobium senzhongii TaxID=2663859 RepID=A0A8I0K1S5_9ACTN|nr:MULTISPECIES: TetR/AcrR family transcriptional regulator [Aeromicrobium]MBC9227273.1 TetR/AcrR family transcriptional regulator [Aeromicrobium senzhongii]MCQ3999371.1 TetR family transcriptional regulator [Aeromicrobium sp. 636]